MTTPNNRRPLVVAGVLGLAVALVYGQVLGFAFVEWDDPTYVTENPAVQAGLTWQGLLWACTAWHATNWHPLTWLSHMLDQAVFGAWAGGHHLTSLLLHAANTVLVYLLFERTTRATGRSAVVAGLFALHPLHVESVAWVSERKDVLSACGVLLALHAYVDWAETRRPRAYAFALVGFVLACLAKPMAVTFPGLLVLLDVWPLGRLSVARRANRTPDPGEARSRRAAARVAAVERESRAAWGSLGVEKLPFVAVAIAVSVVTLAAQTHGGAVAETAVLPLAERVGNALVSYVAYLWMTIWPSGLAFFYPYRQAPSAWMPLGAAAVLIAVTAAAVRAARTHPYVTVGWLWYLGMLVPVIGFVQVGDQAMADRYTYLPLLGPFVIVAWGTVDLAVRWRVPTRGLAAAAAAVLVTCGLLSIRQAATWRASVPLFEHALAVTRDNYTAHDLLGYVLYADRRLDEAAAHFAAAVAARPTMYKAHSNLGLALASQGKFAEAIPHYREALRLRPDYATAVFNLAVAFDRTGASDAASREVERAVTLARQQGDAVLMAEITQWQRVRGR
jgi:hypothetical protein